MIVDSTFTTKTNHHYSVIIDEDSQNPREFHHEAHFFCMDHRRYKLRDDGAETVIEKLYKKYANQDDASNKDLSDKFAELVKNKVYVRPLYLYDHSGVVLECDYDYNFDGRDRFDYSLAGFVIYDCLENEITDEDRKVIQGELDTFNAYLNGEVFCIYDNDSEEYIDCGLYGYNQLEEAIDRIKCADNNEIQIEAPNHDNTIKKTAEELESILIDKKFSMEDCYDTIRMLEQTMVIPQIYDKNIDMSDNPIELLIYFDESGEHRYVKISKIEKGGRMYRSGSDKPISILDASFGELWILLDELKDRNLVD